MASRLSKLFRRRVSPAESTPPHEISDPGVSPPDPRGDAANDRGAVLDHLRDKLVVLSEGRLSAASIDPAVHMLDYGYIDSMSAAELLAFVEDEFDLQIEDVEITGRLATLDALVDFIWAERAR